MANVASQSTESLIDLLGSMKAQIAEMAKVENAIKAALIERIGVGNAAEGDVFRVAISAAERAVLDMAAVRAKLSPQFIAAHTNVSEVISVRVSARSAALAKLAA